MFNQFEPNVKATISFLKLLNVKVTNSTVNETLQNHPDWPSMLCITDSLSKWNIPNGVGKIETNNIDELPTPFIAYTNNREFPLVIITEVSDASIKQLSNVNNKETILSKEDFFKTWNGVYLIAEPTEHSGEQNYDVVNKKNFLKALIPLAVLLLLATLSLLFLNRLVASSTSLSFVNKLTVYIQYTLLIVGTLVTSLLLWYEVDKNNPLLQKVCTGIAKGNCNAILTGKQAKVFSWLSWSEVGFFYFVGALFLLIGSNNLNFSMLILSWLGVLALPYTVFSVYYQWKIAKQWCVLCLAVQGLLLIGGVNIIKSNFLFTPLFLSLVTMANSLMLLTLPVFGWFTIKPFIIQLQEAKNTKREYLRIKFNAEIFETLLKKQKKITHSTQGIGIDIGNLDATNTIVKVCNPYCGPCATAHPKIEALIEQNKNIMVKIIFTTENNEANPATKPVRHLLAIAEKNNKVKTKHALDDWYLPEKKDYAVFEKKHPMNGELLKQGHKLEAMDKWCKAEGIAATPTIFINGQQLPDAYSIENIQYFLLD